ncbi:MAG: N-formylglutamate amidohydrolase [Litoreibacter sp.]|nr:N-formylglutamate amidohydrolase [Litoreibacter sp.]
MTYLPVKITGADRPGRIVLVCDHATNTVPTSVNGGCLGLHDKDMDRHIAYDIGAAGVVRHLAEILDGSAVFSNFSRLVIDPNRGEDDPTLLMRLYDGSIIPGNRHADHVERTRRLDAFHRPYHRGLADVVSARKDPVIVSIHSFTPQLRGRPMRPWQVGILYADDKRLSGPLLDILSREQDLTVGDNEPYSGALAGDTMATHGLRHGRAHVLIELRNDLISTESQQLGWAVRLAPMIEQAVRSAGL